MSMNRENISDLYVDEDDEQLEESLLLSPERKNPWQHIQGFLSGGQFCPPGHEESFDRKAPTQQREIDTSTPRDLVIDDDEDEDEDDNADVNDESRDGSGVETKGISKDEPTSQRPRMQITEERVKSIVETTWVSVIVILLSLSMLHRLGFTIHSCPIMSLSRFLKPLSSFKIEEM
eukprot:scaffold129544_cov44-Attheya_sp.AAC.1